MSDWASQAGRFYTQAGEPAYEVPAKKGGMRPTTIRDAKALNLVPSVTTIISAAARPGLDIWKQQQVLMAALTATRKEQETDADFIRRIMADSQEQAKKAAERGTEIHGAIESSFADRIWDTSEHFDKVVEVRRAVHGWFGVQAWLPEKSFAHDMGYGGKVDLHSPSCVIDIKTKDSLDGLKLYDEHLMQLAAYAQGLGLVKGLDWPRCGIMFVNRNKPEATIMEASQDELWRGWRAFCALHTYWCAINQFTAIKVAA